MLWGGKVVCPKGPWSLRVDIGRKSYRILKPPLGALNRSAMGNPNYLLQKHTVIHDFGDSLFNA